MRCVPNNSVSQHEARSTRPFSFSQRAKVTWLAASSLHQANAPGVRGGASSVLIVSNRPSMMKVPLVHALGFFFPPCVNYDSHSRRWPNYTCGKSYCRAFWLLSSDVCRGSAPFSFTSPGVALSAAKMDELPLCVARVGLKCERLEFGRQNDFQWKKEG